MNKALFSLVGALALVGCTSKSPKPLEPSPGHLRPDAVSPVSEIPAPVMQAPILPAPQAGPKTETYTVVVSEVPVKELLFALARDADLNVDIHQGIIGDVTLNAVDQTLPQILERLSRQIDIRYSFEGNTLVVLPDAPYLRTYTVDYLNLSRKSKSSVNLSTEIASVGGAGGAAGGTGAGGRSGSSTDVENVSDNVFWTTLVESVRDMLGGGEGEEANRDVIPNPEAGVLTVRATEQQHRVIQEYIDRVTTNARRQVLIEATIVEVELSDEYQAGVDWSKVRFGEGLSLLTGNAAEVVTTTAFGATNNTPFFVLDYQSADDRNNSVNLTVKLLKEFGNAKVLSSPKLMALNNQTAVLKVVENIVYFEIDRETIRTETSTDTTVESKAITIPVGLVMNLTPQISDADTVILSIRPTISRVAQFVEDPVVSGNLIPQILVREMDSVLQVASGQIAVLGGLMQDEDARSSSGVPWLGDQPGIGEAFKYRRNEVAKSELVIFLRPVVVREPSIDKDLREFRPFLERVSGRVMPTEVGAVQ